MIVKYEFKKIFLISRTKKRFARQRNNDDSLKNYPISGFFTSIQNIIENNIKDAFYQICIVFNNLKNKIFKQIASEMLQNRNMLDIKTNNHCYSYILEIIYTKTYKLNKLQQINHIHVFASITLTTKPYKLFDFKKYLIILTYENTVL